jgi:hypothetical protein
VTEYDAHSHALDRDEALQRCIEHNEWHRTHRALIEQWDADLFG